MGAETVELSLEVVRIVERSVLVSDGDVTEWLPLSQVEFDEDTPEGETIVFTIPEWLATEKGLV
jgi:hypothetical protein